MTVRGLLFEAERGTSRFLVEPGATVLVGRRPPMDGGAVRVRSILVSRRHLALVGHADGQVTVADAGSAGGFMLDDVRVPDGTPVAPGAVLRLGADVVYRARPFTGETLVTALGRGPLPIPVVGALARDVLGDLHRLHQAGEVHGAIGPHEILRGDDGRATLLVRGWRALDDDGSPVPGNPRYLAPETLDQGRLVPASDLYALGLVLYEAMAGRFPFADDSPQAMLGDKRFGGAPPWPPRWSTALQDFLLRFLLLHPEDRRDTGHALAMVDELWPRPQ